MAKRYSKDHEWIDVSGGVATIGVTNHAQEQLGDVVFVDLPAVGRKVAKGEAAAVVESVKAASDVYAPVSGEVVEVNAALPGDPAKINQDAEGGAWFMRIRLSNESELADLMDEAGYKAFVG